MFIALSGRQAGSNVVAKLLSAASFSWYSRLSTGSSVVQTMETLLWGIRPRALMTGSASFAFVGDIVIAEPKTLVGFAGPRVIEQTVREKLPEGFQRSEFLLEHGAIDQICDRREMRDRLSDLLAMLGRQPAPEVA